MKINSKSKKGITLISLVITIIILIILTATVTLNVGQFGERKNKANFENDMNSLQEEISQYYARTKILPLANKYTNTLMLTNIRNVNDNNNYYVIDLRQLEVKLSMGNDYMTALSRGEETSISDLTDIYIINEQSHTIYYPAGVNYNGKVHYTLDETYSNVKGEQNL